MVMNVVFFLETFREDVLQQAGINAHFVQDNHSRSSQGVFAWSALSNDTKHKGS